MASTCITVNRIDEAAMRHDYGLEVHGYNIIYRDKDLQTPHNADRRMIQELDAIQNLTIRERLELFIVKKSRCGLVVKALDSQAKGCGFKSCLAQDKDYWWGKVSEAHLQKCAYSPEHCPLWLGDRLHSKSSMPHKK